MANYIASMGGIQIPDFAATIAAGRQMYQQQQDAQQQNALRAFISQNAPELMSGDQNALAGLAAISPEVAVQLRNQNLSAEATRAGMANDKARLDLARSSAAAERSNAAAQLEMAREQARMAVEEHTAKMSADKRQQALETMTKIMPAFANVQSPEEWDARANQLGYKELVGQFGQKDPLMARAQGVIDALTPKDNANRYRVVGGTLVDLDAQGGPSPVLRDQEDPLSGIGKLAADFKAGRIDQDQYNAGLQDMAGQGMSIESDGQGGFKMVQGPGVSTVGKPLTESQSKDNYYLTAVQHAASDLDKYEQSLTGAGGAANAVAGAVPGGGFLQSEDYQVGQVAAREWGAAVLRKESGAALTSSDMEWLTSRFIPVPGDKPATIERKRQARQTAEAGLASGMSPEQIKAVTNALGEAGKPRGPASGPQPAGEGIDSILRRYGG